MPNTKNFLSIKDQVSLLKSRGLKISNEGLLEWYLNSYNYQNLINGYNDYFMVNNDRHTNKYKQEATSAGIIELFNFDRTISKYFLSEIQNIERMISTSFAYIISKLLYENGVTDGKLFELNQKDKLFKEMFINKFVWQEFLKRVNRNFDIKKEPFKKYKNYKEIPLWFSIIYLSFGDVIYLLEYLREHIFYLIVKNTKLKFPNELSKKEIISILKTLKDIRNRVCHNNVLFNISINRSSKRFPIQKLLKIKKRKIKLFDIANVISKILPSNNNEFIDKEIRNRIKNFKEIDKAIVKEIKTGIGYK